MKKKRFLLVNSLILCNLISFPLAFAGELKIVTPTLESATVFFRGAELTFNASVNVVSGENEIYIEGLSPVIDHNSLKIKTGNGVIVSSHEFSIDYLKEKELSIVQKRLQDSINWYNKQIEIIKVNQNTNKELLDLLQANKSIAGSQTGLSVAELTKMMDYYKEKTNELHQEIYADNEKSKFLKDRIGKLEKQLQEEQGKNNKNSGVLKLNLNAATAKQTNITVTYYTAMAGWTPYYDIHVESTEKPIKIESKAKVMQTTGLDWDKVKITLSTTSPSTGKVAPLFSAWFLNFQSPYQSRSSSDDIMSALQGRVAGLAVQNTYSYNKVEEVVATKPQQKPLLIVDGEVMEGWDLDDIDPSMIESVDILKDASASAIYGAKAANGTIVVKTKTMDDYISREENELNMVYTIDLPYTIQGNGKEQGISLHTLEVAADFKYYAVPKLDSETFLLAEISNWEKLGLINGKANITYDGTYVGETVLNVNSTQQKLSLTLGTDKRIAVKREKLQDYSSRKFMGNDVRQEFVYQTTVKNNQNHPIKMVLKDQYPLSAQKDIDVELLKETTAPTHKNEDVGVLNWEFELQAGETKTFRTAYSVKYPKNKNINL